MLDSHDQMLKGSRFIWYNWTQAITAVVKETESEFIFTGKIRCFSYLSKDIIHQRKVVKVKNKLHWIVTDEILNKPGEMNMRQLWHTNEVNIDFNSSDNSYTLVQGWKSLYYGEKEEIKQIEFKTTDNTIETKIQVL